MKKNLVNTIIATCLSFGMAIAPVHSVFAATKSDSAIENVKTGTVFSLEENRQAAMDMMEQDQSTTTSHSALKAQATLASTTQTKQEKFFASISGYAKKLSQKYNIYASVMMAQSALESAWGESKLSKKANNFFGVKGSYKGKYVTMDTKEYSNGKWVTVKQKFRKYPSFYESMEDNASKLRNGVSWNASYYKGTWYENAKSYKDSTSWLEGRYATDPDYSDKLNSIIEKYGLTKYDKYDSILSNKAVNYKRTILNSKTYYFYSDIFRTNSKVKKQQNASKYAHKEVQVIREAKTSRASWIKVKYNGKVLGWVNKKAGTTYDAISSQKNVNVSGKIKKGYTIYNKIYGTESGVKKAATSDTYVNNELKVTKEAVTKRGTWAKIQKGSKVLGWVNKKALTYFDKITSNKKVSELGSVKSSAKTNIYKQIYQTSIHATVVSKAQKYANCDLKIIREAVTKRGTWVNIQSDGKTIGWIAKSSLHYYDKITSKKSLQRNAKVEAKKTNAIYKQVYNTGIKAVKVADLTDYNGKEIQVIGEATTKSGTFSQIKSGSKTLGWVRKTRLHYYDSIVYNKAISKTGGIKARKTDIIYTAVYNTSPEVKKVSSLSTYNNKNVTIVREAKANSTIWYQFKIGNKLVGWTKSGGIKVYDKLIYNKQVSRKGKVANPKKYYFYNKIYGTALDITKQTSAKKKANQKVTIIREAKTSRATWVQVKIGKKTIGWVNKKAIK